jgi:hypothetical protein
LKLSPSKEYKYYMTLNDYIAENDIDPEATEAEDLLIELIHADLIRAVEVYDYREADRLQLLIESINLKQKE